MMMVVAPFLIILGIIIFAVVRGSSRNSSKKEKQVSKNELKNKFKNNEVVQEFANNIYLAMCVLILEEPHRDHTFHIHASETQLQFGVALQHILYKNIGEFAPRPNRQVIFEYNFAARGLPDLKDEEQCTLFSIAVAELVQTKLWDSEKGFPITIRVITNVVDSDEEEHIAFGKMSAITYTHPQVQGDW